MKRPIQLGLILGLAVLVGPATAQTTQPGPSDVPHHSPHHRKGHPLEAADTNEDGQITAEEYEAFQHERFARADANGDGHLDRDEVLSLSRRNKGRIPPAPGPEWRSDKDHDSRRHRPGPEEILNMFDTNDDGSLQENEVPEGMATHFAHIDANGDGNITMDELEEARPKGKRPGGDRKKLLKRLDKNEDGMLQKDEVPERLAQRFDRIDTNGDGAIDQQELSAMGQKRGRDKSGRRGRRGPDRRPEPPSDDSLPVEPAQPFTDEETMEM